MADPSHIRFFVRAQKFYQMLGICPSYRMEHKWNFNSKNIFILYLCVQMFISSMASCIFEVDTLFDYCANIYVCLTELANIFSYSLQICEIVNISNFIHQIDEFIGKCKLNSNSCKFSLSTTIPSNLISIFVIWQFQNGVKENLDTSIVPYIKLNEKIETISKWIYFAIRIFTFIIMVPALLVTAVNYFVFDLKNDSFFSIPQMMWVHT